MFYTAGAKYILNYIPNQKSDGRIAFMPIMLYNQHAKHAKVRGSGGMPPKENFENYMLSD